MALAFLLALALPAAAADNPGHTVVFQPSHQTDTGENYNEAETCGAIVDAAMAAAPHYDERKVWSYHERGLHHARQGSNTKLEHTTALEGGKLSGYAWELAQSNARPPEVFISVHNNGGTNRNAVWGYIHDGDALEAENRRLSNMLIEEIALATDLENRGTHLDSTTGRNDYRCAATGRLGFYSIDENVNRAPLRVVLEIGDLDVSRRLLNSRDGRRRIGRAIKRGLARYFEGK